MPEARHPVRQVVLVGGDSLLGREVREVFTNGLPGAKIKLAGSEDTAVLTEQGGEAVVMTSLDADLIAEADVVVLAGSAESSQRALKMVQMSGEQPVVLDLTHALEDSSDFRLRAPLAEPEANKSHCEGFVEVAHPAAIVLAAFLRALHAKHPYERAVANVFEPVSERGREGVEELQRQTVQLLSFKKTVKKVFDAQVSFNMLPRYGQDAPVKLETVELLIETQLASLLGNAPPAPLPSLRLLQVPVMHAHGFSLWVELASKPDWKRIRKAFPKPLFDWWGEDLDAPNTVNASGQEGITIGAVEQDRNNPRAAWFWLVADNFLIVAANALELTKKALAKERS